MISITDEQIKLYEEYAEIIGSRLPEWYMQWSESLINRCFADGDFNVLVELLGDDDLALQVSGEVFRLAVAAAEGFASPDHGLTRGFT